MQQVNWPTIPGLDMPSPTVPDPPNPLTNKLWSFKKMCYQYPGDEYKGIYVVYKLLSAYAHPTSFGAMAYVDQQSGMLAPQATGPTDPFIVQTAACLINAGEIVSPLLQGDPLRDALIEAARRLRPALSGTFLGTRSPCAINPGKPG